MDNKSEDYQRDHMHSPSAPNIGILLILHRANEEIYDLALAALTSEMSVRTISPREALDLPNLISPATSSTSLSDLTFRESELSAISPTSSRMSFSSPTFRRSGLSVISPATSSASLSDLTFRESDLSVISPVSSRISLSDMAFRDSDMGNLEKDSMAASSELINEQQFVDEGISVDRDILFNKNMEDIRLLSGLYAFLLYQGKANSNIQYLILRSTQFSASAADTSRDKLDLAVPTKEYGLRESNHGGIRVIKKHIIRKHPEKEIITSDNPLVGGEIQFSNGNISWWNAQSGGFSPGTPYDDTKYKRSLETGELEKLNEYKHLFFSEVKKVMLPSKVFTFNSYKKDGSYLEFPFAAGGNCQNSKKTRTDNKPTVKANRVLFEP